MICGSSRLLTCLFGGESQILILGLSFSGKTTILYRLQLGQVVSTEATIGFNVETVHHNNIKFQISDFGNVIVCCLCFAVSLLLPLPCCLLRPRKVTANSTGLLLHSGIQKKPTSFEMAVTFYDINSPTGLKKLDDYLLTRSYITGYQASKDDIAVYGALSGAPSSEYVNASRWYNHIDALLRISGVSGDGCGVVIEGSAPVAEEAVAAPPTGDSKAATAEDDDDDMDLFGEETEEEKKASEERAAAVKVSSKKKESGKSSVLLDVKPWDDETDMQKLEEAVRSVKMEGLFWGASKLVPVGYGIKKLQIMLTIVR